MFLHKEKSGIYYLYYTNNEGKKKKISTKEKLLSKANQFLKSFNPEESTALKPKLKVSEAIFIYLRNCENRLSAKTIIDLKSELKQFAQYFNPGTDISAIKKVDLLGYINSRLLVSKFVGSKSQRYLRTFFSFLENDCDFLKDNPFIGIKKIKVAESSKSYLNQNQLDELLASCNNADLTDFYLFAFHSGMRLNEQLNLELSDINLEEKLIYIRNKEAFQTKSGKERIVPIPPDLEIILKRQMDSNKRFLFQDSSGNKFKPDYISKNFKRLIRKNPQLDQKLHYHSLRHSFCVCSLKKEIPIFYVSKVLGHSSVSITEKVYSHHTTTDVLRAFKVL